MRSRKHKKFAAIAELAFSPTEWAYVRERTSCGPSVLDVVRQAVRAAALGRWRTKATECELEISFQKHHALTRQYDDIVEQNRADAAATVSDNDLLRLLAEIEAMALAPFPFPDDEQHDARLPFALAEIAGIAGAAIRPHIPSPTCWCNPVRDDSEAHVWIHNYQPAQNAALQGEDA